MPLILLFNQQIQQAVVQYMKYTSFEENLRLKEKP